MAAVTNALRLGIATAILLSGPEIGFVRNPSAYPSGLGPQSVVSSKRLQLLATTGKNMISQREPLELQVSLRNNTRTQVYVIESNPLVDYQIEVRDEAGRLVSPTPEGKDSLMRALWMPRRISVLIRPGEEKRQTFEVNRIYAMPAGSYTLTAKRRVMFQKGKESIQLISNEVKVKVTD